MPRPLISLEEFFWQRVNKTDYCWLWTGRTQIFGYGLINLGRKGKTIGAHRASWEIHHGPIPDGLLVCHTCDNPPCVNPEHLFLGTYIDNMKDAWKKGRLHLPDQSERLARTHCPYGHPWDEKNTYIYGGDGRHKRARICRECLRLRNIRYYQNKIRNKAK